MTDSPVLPGLEASGWAGDYLARASGGDLFAGAPAEMAPRWRAMLDRLSEQGQGDPATLAGNVERQAQDLGLAFRLTGDEQERPWPLSPIPMLIGAGEWTRMEQGLMQRAELLERVISDIYSGQSLVREGKLPAAVVTGSPHYWRVMTGAAPPRGHYLHFYAADLGRGPDGEWRVLADRVRTPVGVGYALENRLALSRATGDLLGAMNTRRLAPFFADLRRGLAVDCQRADPRIGLLTPGRFNQSYAEQAHLARYLGLMLVEGDDLIVSDGRLFVRTIEGLKRIILGRIPVSELGGPIKIAQASGESLSMGPLALVSFIALVSINLGFINLLPVPVLDGGHLLFYAVEAVRRRPVEPQVMEWAYRGGLVAILALMLFVTFNDLGAYGVWRSLAGLIG